MWYLLQQEFILLVNISGKKCKYRNEGNKYMIFIKIGQIERPTLNPLMNGVCQKWRLKTVG